MLQLFAERKNSSFISLPKSWLLKKETVVETLLKFSNKTFLNRESYIKAGVFKEFRDSLLIEEKLTPTIF